VFVCCSSCEVDLDNDNLFALLAEEFQQSSGESYEDEVLMDYMLS